MTPCEYFYIVIATLIIIILSVVCVELLIDLYKAAKKWHTSLKK